MILLTYSILDVEYGFSSKSKARRLHVIVEITRHHDEVIYRFLSCTKSGTMDETRNNDMTFVLDDLERRLLTLKEETSLAIGRNELQINRLANVVRRQDKFMSSLGHPRCSEKVSIHSGIPHSSDQSKKFTCRTLSSSSASLGFPSSNSTSSTGSSHGDSTTGLSTGYLVSSRVWTVEVWPPMQEQEIIAEAFMTEDCNSVAMGSVSFVNEIKTNVAHIFPPSRMADESIDEEDFLTTRQVPNAFPFKDWQYCVGSPAKRIEMINTDNKEQSRKESSKNEFHVFSSTRSGQGEGFDPQQVPPTHFRSGSTCDRVPPGSTSLQTNPSWESTNSKKEKIRNQAHLHEMKIRALLSNLRMRLTDEASQMRNEK